MKWNIEDFIGLAIVLFIVIVIVLVVEYRRRKSLKEYYERLHKQTRVNDYNIQSRLDDICIKHHGGLPYEPD